MSTPNHAPDLAKTLHDQFCRSTSWETAEGAADHVKRAWVSRARTILNAPDPAVELHDTVACDAEADPTFPDGCGVDRERHITFCRDWLIRNAFLPASWHQPHLPSTRPA